MDGKAKGKAKPISSKSKSAAPEADAPEPDSPEMIEWRKTNAKRIDAAVNLLRPSSRDDVERALIEVEYMHRQLVSGFIDETKPAKKAASDLAKALERVQRLIKNESLPSQLTMFYWDVVKKWLEDCKKIATKRSRKHPQKEAELKKLVVREAAFLMGKHGGAHSNFVKLANTLYDTLSGKKGVDLTNQCAAYLRKPRKAK